MPTCLFAWLSLWLQACVKASCLVMCHFCQGPSAAYWTLSLCVVCLLCCFLFNWWLNQFVFCLSVCHFVSELTGLSVCFPGYVCACVSFFCHYLADEGQMHSWGNVGERTDRQKAMETHRQAHWHSHSQGNMQAITLKDTKWHGSYCSCVFQFGCCFQSWKCDQRYLTVVAVHLWLSESEPAPPVLGDVPSLLHGTCGRQQQLWRTQMGNLHLLKGTSYSLLFLIKFNLHTNFYVCVLVNHYLGFGFVAVFIWGCVQVYLSTSVRHDRTLRLFHLHLYCDTKQTAPRTPEMCVNVTCTFVPFCFSSSQTKNSDSQSQW